MNGEKLYVTKITVDRGKDTIEFDLFSDSYGDSGRFKGLLKIQFAKKTLVSADLATVDTTIGEVLKIQPPEDAKTEGARQQRTRRERPTAGTRGCRRCSRSTSGRSPSPPIAPPPPPADEPPAPPKTISLGQTKDQVVSSLGQPEKTAKIGTKEIYFYKDLKVTFVNGKVSDVQ